MDGTMVALGENPTPDVSEQRPTDRLPSEALTAINRRALARRAFLGPGYEFRPISVHNTELQEIKRKYPYLGYVDVEVEGVPPFVMFSNNDDQVAQAYFWYGPDAFESVSLRLWRRLAERSQFIFDIGAFTGVYSLTAARVNHEAQIYSLEPVKRTFARLVVNLQANRLGRRVRAFDIALGDVDGETIMHVFMGYLSLDSGSSLLEKSGKRVAAREHVETKRLDTFVEEHGIPSVDLAKLDVEQAEKMVIAGAERVLSEHRPHLLIEVSTADGLRELIDFLSPHGYGFAVIDDLNQTIRLNDLGAHEGVLNALFSPMPPEELRAFCMAVTPLPPDHVANNLGQYRNHHYQSYPELNMRLQDAEEWARRLRRATDAMRGSRSWRVASAVRAAAAGVRRTGRER
jgi:FkbM family methyltransferase